MRSTPLEEGKECQSQMLLRENHTDRDGQRGRGQKRKEPKETKQEEGVHTESYMKVACQEVYEPLAF